MVSHVSVTYVYMCHIICYSLLGQKIITTLFTDTHNHRTDILNGIGSQGIIKNVVCFWLDYNWVCLIGPAGKYNNEMSIDDHPFVNYHQSIIRAV